MRTETLYIADDNTVFFKYIDCLQYERNMAERKKRELAKKIRETSDQFLLSVGFDSNIYKSLWEKYEALNRTWLVFDRYGEIEGLKTCDNRNYPGNGCNFCYVSGEDKKDRNIMENWLLDHRLYAQRLCSFVERNLEFYGLDILQKLEHLGWKVKNGVLF